MNSSVNQKYFCLFSNCILTKGYDRSSIIDLQRKAIHFIPNELYFILRKLKYKTVGWTKEYYDNNPVIEDYFNFLITKELGIYVDSHKLFPPINFTYRSPNLITNAIVEFSDSSDYEFRKVIEQLSELYCESLEIRFLSNIKLSDLDEILCITAESSFRSITIGLPFSAEYSVENLHKLLNIYPRIVRVHIYQSDFSKIINDEEKQPLIIYHEQKSLTSEHCGNISPDYFSVCMEMVCESLAYNTCLHQKVCITEDGSIKNCPAMHESFGNIKNLLLKDVVSFENFQYLWNIKKDDIEVCKDCEMRYVCHDCRAYITNPQNIYSKPCKCSYDPYTSTWNK